MCLHAPIAIFICAFILCASRRVCVVHCSLSGLSALYDRRALMVGALVLGRRMPYTIVSRSDVCSSDSNNASPFSLLT